MDTLKLRPAQKKALHFVVSKRRSGLFLPMGYGKTPITLAALRCWLNSAMAECAVVIAPPQVARHVWAQEAAKWDQFKDLRIAVLSGTPKQRQRLIDKGADIYVVSSSLTEWLVKKSGIKFDTLIIDESTHFKTPGSKRFRALRYSKMVKACPNVLLLTGTPAPNGLEDLWSQLYLIDRGKRLHTTLTQFREDYCILDTWSGFPNWKMRKGSDTEIQQRIDDVVMTGADIVELPDLTRLTIECELPGGEFVEEYCEMYDEMVVQLGDGTAIDAANAAVKIAKLSQMANGCVYDSDGNTIQYHDSKLKALEALVEGGEPMIVVYSTTSDRDRILHHFKGSAALSGKSIKAWNAGKLDMLVLHPAAAGHGLNLQFGGSMMVWYGLTYNLEHYQQMNARLHRQGQTEAVRIYHIVLPNPKQGIKSIDYVIMDALGAKDRTQTGLLRAMTNRILA